MPLPEVLLSNYGTASSIPAPVNRLMAAFAQDFRDDVDINLGVGYVNENTIPRDLIEEALHEVLQNPNKYRVCLNYGGPVGSPNLISSIRQFHLDHQLGGLTDDILSNLEIIVGPNGATSLLEGITHVMAPGIVLTADPIYYIYCNLLERMGFEVCAIPEDEQGLDPDSLEQKLRELGDRVHEIRFFYLVTVNNPTCSVLTNQRRQRVVEIATRLSRKLGRNIPVFFDKAYESLIHDPNVETVESGLLHDELGLVYEIGTLSKILAPALRIGYMIGPGGPLLDAMAQKTSDAGFSAPLINQEIASYLLDHHVSEQIAEVNAGYRQKAKSVRQWIDSQLGDHLSECRGGSAGFYFYLTLDGIATHENSAFFRFLARTTGRREIDGLPPNKHPRVVYLPGEFCVHPQGDLITIGQNQLRLSYGFEELPRIEQAIDWMRQAIFYAHASSGSR